jgi:hypothetical protein
MSLFLAMPQQAQNFLHRTARMVILIKTRTNLTVVEQIVRDALLLFYRNIAQTAF